MARIDFTTQIDKKQEYFSDFLSSFDKSPLSNDLARTKNENSVKQSVRNLVLTSTGERFFQPNVGGNTYRMLFEPFTGFTADDLEKDILNTITQNEPRVSPSELSINVIPHFDQNAFTVNIFFVVINTNEPTSLSLVLQRVR